MTTYSHVEICELLHKDSLYVKEMQKTLGLPVTKQYSSGYLRFLRKIVALRTFSVGWERICELFELEKKVLVLLRFDSLLDSPTWYLEASESKSGKGLLLTGFDIGTSLNDSVFQQNLDFGKRDKELFDSHEMGEDVRLILKEYAKKEQAIRTKVEKEWHVLQDALDWGETVLSTIPV